MGAKATRLQCALLLTVLAAGAARAAEPTPTTGEPEVKPVPPAAMDKEPASQNGKSAEDTEQKNTTGETPTPITPSPPGHLSSYLTYQRPDCCGPIGANGPILTELYVRTGPTFPNGRGVLGNILQPGWEIEGGGRSLFYNPSMSGAWTVDISLSHEYDHGHPERSVPLTVTEAPPSPLPGVIPAPPQFNVITQIVVRSMQMTYVNASIGREFYLFSAADSPGPRWRAGIDVGGRLGTAKLDLREVTPVPNELNFRGHLTDTLYGPFGAIHTDVEIPGCGCCIFMGGVRLEGDYISCDILKGLNNSNLTDLKLLMTFGVRF